VIGVGIDERPLKREPPVAFVIRAAMDKARAAQSALGIRADHPILAADTAVVVDGQILGKPRDRREGLEMLGLLSGRSHQVATGIALLHRETAMTRLSVSLVSFRVLTAEEVGAYWDTGEPADKAGAYAIQGRGAVFVKHLEGSYSGVMGLPLFETAQMLGQAGIGLWSEGVKGHTE
jgi:septum formation protein